MTTTEVRPVDVHSFVRAETDLNFSRMAKTGSFGKFVHRRMSAPIGVEDAIRMTREILYSTGLFDLDAAPVTITLPDPGKRYMSMTALSEDHYAIDVVYGPGSFTYDRNEVGTRYAFFIVRTFAYPDDPADIAAANRLQDAIQVEQAAMGSFEIPAWDPVTLEKTRDALTVLGSQGGLHDMFGSREQVDPIDHLIGTAIAWGGNPGVETEYDFLQPPQNDGKTVYRLTLKDVPGDGFWSVAVYNAQGHFERNERNAYFVNSLTAKPNADGSVTIQFGGCQRETPNCLPIMPGWNYTFRVFRPGKEILAGTWKLPEPEPVR